MNVSSIDFKLVACAWEQEYELCAMSEKEFGICVECEPTSIVLTFETSLQEARIV